MACKISDGKIDAILEKLEDARLNASLANGEVRAFEFIPDFYACTSLLYIVILINKVIYLSSCTLS